MFKSALKWLAVAIPIWGLLTGIVYVLSPFLVHGPGNTATPDRRRFDLRL